MSATVTHPDALAMLLADLMRRGMELAVDPAKPDALRYRPKRAMTADLAKRVKANKLALLALLRPVEADGPDGEPAERDAIAGYRDGLPAMPRDSFGALLVGRDEPARTHYRRMVKAILLRIYHDDPDRALELRDAWAERMAIASIDGRQSEDDAERIAWEELRDNT